MDYKKRRNMRVFILGLLLMFLTLQLYVSFKDNNQNIEFVLVGNSQDEVVENIKIDENKVLELRKQYGNNDIVGYITIDGTSINEPVLKYKDNDYYLHHDNYGNYEINGSIFQDHRISLDDRKVLIYGHSSTYDSIPFNELENYYNESFYEKHRYIKLITENNEYDYEIFSVYVETSDFSYMNLKISDTTYNEHLKKYKNKSLYDTKVDVNDNDEIIILQTCSNDNRYAKSKKKYLLVIGKKIHKEV